MDQEHSQHAGCPVPPVTDWISDFDHAHPDYNANAPAIWDELRERCPVAFTERYGGTWLPVRHADVHAVAYDTENFSSVGVVVANQKPTWDQAPIGGAPPITSDPPFHAFARRLLLPAFSPKAIDPLEPGVRALCAELLDAVEAKRNADGTLDFDAAVDYAQHIPVRVIAHMLGFPESDADLFRSFVHDVLEDVAADPEARAAKFQALGAYIRDRVQEAREHPADNLLGYLLGVETEAGPLSDEHVVGTVILTLIAGIDTTWSAIGSSLLHLATNAPDLERLVTEPDLMTTAVEELLRAYAPVTMARVARNDVELGGCPVRAGDWLLLPFPAANRDPDVFERADEVLLDREHNRHAAFGLGIHRCIGSNLARLELRVAIEEFIKRFPRFELRSDEALVWSVGQVRGPRRLPVTTC